MSRATPDIEELRQEMTDGRPRREEMSPQRQNGSLYIAIMAQARHDSGLDYGDPSSLDQYWFADEGLLVIDLGDQDGD